jgi:hypothetical protein
MPAYTAADAALTADTLWDLAQHAHVPARTPSRVRISSRAAYAYRTVRAQE